MYGFFLAIPDYRLRPTGRPIITFEERAPGAPEAVKAWFYPGDNYGHEFVYSKVKAAQLAQVNNEPVPSMPNELTPNTTKPATSMNEPNVNALKQAPLTAQQPNQQEQQLSEAFPPTPPPAQAPAQPENLPQTASPVPLIGLIGLLSVAGAGWLSLLAGKAR